MVGYAMERSASLWCTIGGIPGAQQDGHTIWAYIYGSCSLMSGSMDT